MKTLYNLTQEQLNLLSGIEEGGGEVDAETFEMLSANMISIEEKYQNYYYLIQHITSDLNVIDKELERLEKIAKSKQKLIETLKDNIKQSMESLDIDKIKAEHVEIRLQKSPISCSIINIEAVPEQFKQIRTEIVVNKSALIKYFKDTIANSNTPFAEADIPQIGAKFVQNKHLRFV